MWHADSVLCIATQTVCCVWHADGVLCVACQQCVATRRGQCVVCCICGWCVVVRGEIRVFLGICFCIGREVPKVPGRVRIHLGTHYHLMMIVVVTIIVQYTIVMSVIGIFLVASISFSQLRNWGEIDVESRIFY